MDPQTKAPTQRRLRRGASLALAGAIVLAACGSSDPDEQTNDAPAAPAPAGESDPAPAAPTPPDAAATPTAIATVGGETISFELAQCLTFGERFMSGLGRTADGAEINFSYELPDFGEDGDDSEYTNNVSVEIGDGEHRWEAGVLTTSAGDQATGVFNWTRDGDSLSGSGTAENMWSPEPRDTTDLEVTITC